jgi:DNA-binding NarL/FixJ family response regulator
VNAIVAATTGLVRSNLVNLTQAAGFTVSAQVTASDSLNALLRTAPDAWVVTGGTPITVRPFIRAARAADAAAVALVSGRDRHNVGAELHRGGIALLHTSVDPETFRIAVAASRAGLAVWDPAERIDLDRTRNPDTPLSPRERDVLQLAGAGSSTKAIARQLRISPNTVKFHLHAAFDKLGVATRAEAVMAALRRGELAV